MADPRSGEVTDGKTRAPARAMLRAVGMTDADWDKPLGHIESRARTRWVSREWEKAAHCVPRRRRQRRRRRLGPPRRQGLRLPARAQAGPRHGCRGRPLSASQGSSRDDLDQLFECVEVMAVDELIDVRQCGGHTARQRGVAGRRLQWVHHTTR